RLAASLAAGEKHLVAGDGAYLDALPLIHVERLRRIQRLIAVDDVVGHEICEHAGPSRYPGVGNTGSGRRQVQLAILVCRGVIEAQSDEGIELLKRVAI